MMHSICIAPTDFIAKVDTRPASSTCRRGETNRAARAATRHAGRWGVCPRANRWPSTRFFDPGNKMILSRTKRSIIRNNGNNQFTVWSMIGMPRLLKQYLLLIHQSAIKYSKIVHYSSGKATDDLPTYTITFHCQFKEALCEFSFVSMHSGTDIEHSEKLHTDIFCRVNSLPCIC